jgi:hypothetical protein
MAISNRSISFVEKGVYPPLDTLRGHSEGHDKGSCGFVMPQ